MSHWLDKIIAEQAAHYGLTVEQHTDLIRGAATHQEAVEAEEAWLTPPNFCGAIIENQTTRLP